MRKKVVAIVGPTAVGKTKLSIFLARKLGGEIINGDAFQVYRGMNIGTAKITAEETEGIPHHLIDIRDPGEDYTAADYQKDARRVIHQITDRGQLPILAGGTGFYMKSALFDYHFPSGGSNRTYREQLTDLLNREGSEALHARLQAVDPSAAASIHPHNLVRVIRALEVFHETGVPFSRQQSGVPDEPIFDVSFIGLDMERSLLYQRINDRVDMMMESGLLNEVRDLYGRGLRNARALQAIGYKEFFPYFEGKVTLDHAVGLLKRNSRHYAKRQLTWFRRQMPVHWFDMTSALERFPYKANEILKFVEQEIC